MYLSSIYNKHTQAHTLAIARTVNIFIVCKEAQEEKDIYKQQIIIIILYIGTSVYMYITFQ